MIYTVTLNPALDRVIEVERLVADDANRVRAESRYAGGKGIDVSRVIKELGGESIALGFVGGYDGLELEGRLIQQGVKTNFTKTQGETRINIIIFDRSKKTQTSLNASGPTIQPEELALFIHQISSLNPLPSLAIISGSLPPGVPLDIYARLIETFKKQGAKVVLDADNEPLKLGLAAGPFMIKPNLKELARLANSHLSTEEKVINTAETLHQEGVEIVIVSQGKEKVLAVTPEGNFMGFPPLVEVKSTVGAGDSLVAGFVLKYSQGKPLKECLQYGIAAGTATTLTPGTELCHKKEVEELFKKVRVVKI